MSSIWGTCQIRLNEKAGKFDEKKKYTGHEYDDSTGLNYMAARYQNPDIGHFLSVDPVYNAIGDENLIESKTGMKLQQLLENPQALNSYSYSYNNPLIYRDQGGEFAFLAPIAAYAVAYAPVWIPAAITAISAIGAGVSSWFMGESVGYMMEGNSHAANQSLDKAHATLGATAIGVGGIMAAGSAISSYGNSVNISKNQATSKNSSVNITNKSWSHVYDRHINPNINLDASKFNSKTDVKGLIQSSGKYSYTIQDNGNYRRVFNTGGNIGVDVQTGRQTSTMTVITRPDGSLVTAHPGSPR